MTRPLLERPSGRHDAQNPVESTECHNGRRYIHADTPLNWSVSYKRFRAAMMRTLSHLTRRGKANRLQDGIGRDVPINRQDGWTITRSVTKSPGPSLPTASAVDGCKDLPTARRTRVPARSSAHYLGSTRKVQSAGLSVLSESAQKRCQLLVKCDGNCSAMPMKTW